MDKSRVETNIGFDVCLRNYSFCSVFNTVLSLEESMKAHPNLYILVDGRKIYAAIEATMSHIRKKETSRIFHHKLLPPFLSPTVYSITSNSTLPSRNLQTPKPLPQLPRPGRTPPHMALPIRITLAITQRPSLCRRRYHLDAILAIGVVSFGDVAGVGFVFFEGFFEGVGGFAFAF